MTKKYNKILFIGFRCVGKTTLSKIVAEKIHYSLYDTDEEIEKDQNKTINEISDNGKNWYLFRQSELNKIKELLQINNIVISGGGGLGVNDIKYNDKLTFGDLQRKEILSSNDTYKILLVSNEEIIRERLYYYQIKQNDRPDIGNISNNINEYLDNNIQIMKKREKFYKEMANIIFDTTEWDKDKENIKKNVIKCVEDILLL